MLRTLSYFNLIFSVVYFLAYQQNGSSLNIAGLLLVVIFNWLALQKLERGIFSFSVFDWLLALLTAVFALFTSYSAVLLILDVLEYAYAAWNTILLIAAGLTFALAILLQLFLAVLKILRKKTD